MGRNFFWKLVFVCLFGVFLLKRGEFFCECGKKKRGGLGGFFFFFFPF